MDKIVITGTGRCGTTFLIQLFTELGFKTGYTHDECKQTIAAGSCDGGIEHTIGNERFSKSEIVKNPRFLWNIESIIPYAKFVIIPVRDMQSVLKSRNYQSNENELNPDGFGGLIHNNIDEEKLFNLNNFYNSIELLVRNNVSFMLLSFPRLAIDEKYLYSKLRKVFKLDRKKFKEIFNKLSDKTKIRF